MPAPIALIAAALEIARIAAPRLVRHLTDSDKAAETAERVVAIAQQVTGTAAPDAALARLQADPNLLLQTNLRLQEIEADVEKAYLGDRQDARRRDVELAKLGQLKDGRKNAMIIGDVLGLLACLVILIFFRKEIPGEVVGMISMIAGIFGAGLRDAHQFEFGSSRSSQMKDETIAQQISKR